MYTMYMTTCICRPAFLIITCTLSDAYTIHGLMLSIKFELLPIKTGFFVNSS